MTVGHGGDDQDSGVVVGESGVGRVTRGHQPRSPVPALARLLAKPGTERSRAIREAKIDPFGAAHRQRLRRVIGSPPDFDERAALAPALIILTTMTTGHPPDRDEIRNRIMPLQNPAESPPP